MKHLEIKTVPNKGRGVFAKKRFKEGDLIEACPIALFKSPEGQRHICEKYAFRWSKGKVAIALGYGSLYNHSYNPNAEYLCDSLGLQLLVYARRNIAVGEEICFNYNGDPESQQPLWFKYK